MKRNANGTGSFVKRGNAWQYAITLGYDEHGKRLRKYFSGKTQKEAKTKADKYLTDKRDGLNVDSIVTFSEWADVWFDNHRENVSATTQESYQYTIRILKDQFGIRKLTSIKVLDIDRFFVKLRKDGRSDSYIRKCRSMLFQILQKAEANDLIRKNPVQFANKIKSTGKVVEKDAFTASELRLLMENLPYDRMGNSIRLLLGTGMRTQELLALEPRYIAEDGSMIYVRQAVKLVKGTVVVGEPKTRESNREIPIPVGLRDCARMLRNTENKYIWEVGAEGRPCNPTYFRDQFRKYLEAVPGVRILTPHCCRHTYVSQMQAIGVDMATIQALVGHTDTDMTYQYLHVQSTIKNDAVEKFDAVFLPVQQFDGLTN